jgi:hypothetical protein
MAFTQLRTTQVEFLEQYLRGTNRELSSAQAAATFGIKNLRARMTDFRQIGLRVRKSKNTVGRTVYSVSRRDMFGDQGKILPNTVSPC